jgi:hypothetical protein
MGGGVFGVRWRREDGVDEKGDKGSGQTFPALDRRRGERCGAGFFCLRFGETLRMCALEIERWGGRNYCLDLS